MEDNLLDLRFRLSNCLWTCKQERLDNMDGEILCLAKSSLNDLNDFSNFPYLPSACYTYSWITSAIKKSILTYTYIFSPIWLVNSCHGCSPYGQPAWETIIWEWGALSHCGSALAVQVLYHHASLVLQHRWPWPWHPDSTGGNCSENFLLISFFLCFSPVFPLRPHLLAWPKSRQIYLYLSWIRQNVVFIFN